ncbi:MAG: sugar ABC transporter permease [Acidimicrobiia bacterium]|nr:sugar ABC transporter permease [Acidimicrobiia bacterium]MYI19017.1 sugar ABC transporter permease [Acidimicrobiia bacterium]
MAGATHTGSKLRSEGRLARAATWRMPRRRARRETLAGAATLPALAFLAIFALFPLYEMVSMAFGDVGFAEVVTGEWEHTTSNFADLPESRGFLDALENTLVFVAIVVVASIAFGLATAHVIRLERLSRRTLQTMMVFAWALPPIISGSVWKFILSGNGVANALLGLVGVDRQLWLADPGKSLYSVAFVTAWQAIPFAALVLKASLLDVPPEQVEAAAVDGATRRHVFVHVTLPHLKPVLVVLTVLITVYAFRSFDLLFVMTQGGPGTSSTTLPFLAWRRAFEFGHFGEGAALACISSAFIVAAAAYYSRVSRRLDEG